MKVETHRDGVRLMQGDAMLSKVLREPGPTHEIFDVLAACVACEDAHARVALLGFAGGGLVAPLRASAWDGALHAVDLDRTGERWFRRLCGTWAGEVRVDGADAAEWLASHRGPWDLIVEDLSVDRAGHIVKPEASFERLPELCRARRASRGFVLVNLLPDTVSWPRAYAAWRPVAPAASVLHFDEYENRFLLIGPGREALRWRTSRMRTTLEVIGSRMARGWRVRPLRAPRQAATGSA